MITIYYDEDCIMCRNYASYQKAKLMFDDVALVDLRAMSGGEREVLSGKARADLTKGILLRFSGSSVEKASLYGGVLDDDGYYYIQGREATVLMAQLGTSEQSGIFGFFNRFLKYPSLAKVLFPLMRLGRKVLLVFTDKSSKFD